MGLACSATSFQLLRILCADSVCISGFWADLPETDTRVWPLGPSGTCPQSPCGQANSKLWLHHWHVGIILAHHDSSE